MIQNFDFSKIIIKNQELFISYCNPPNNYYNSIIIDDNTLLIGENLNIDIKSAFEKNHFILHTTEIKHRTMYPQDEIVWKLVEIKTSDKSLSVKFKIFFTYGNKSNFIIMHSNFDISDKEISFKDSFFSSSEFEDVDIKQD